MILAKREIVAIFPTLRDISISHTSHHFGRGEPKTAFPFFLHYNKRDLHHWQPHHGPSATLLHATVTILFLACVFSSPRACDSR